MRLTTSWIVWAILSAFFAALTALFAKEGVAHIDSNLATAVRTSVVLIMAWFIALQFGRPHELASLDRKTLGFLCASGVATGLSWALLLPRSLARPSLQSRAARQIERRLRSSPGVARTRRGHHTRKAGRRRAHYRRRHCACDRSLILRTHVVCLKG